MNLINKEYYINRELSWLQFNTRVFNQSQNSKLPLLERLKFLAIYGTNLDEFYMIRVAGLMELFASGVNVSGPDGLTPLEQITQIRAYLKAEQTKIEKTYNEIQSKLQEHNLHIKYFNSLSSKHKEFLKEFFINEVFPVVIPIAIDSMHPFPHLNNLSFGLVVKLNDGDSVDNIKYSLIRIPRILKRFVQIQSGVFIPIEEVVREFAGELFPGYEIISSTTYRVTRNADIAIEEEEADDFLEVMEEGLKARQRGRIVRLEIEQNNDKDLINFINSHTNVYDEDIYEFSVPLNLGKLWEIVSLKDFQHLGVKNFTPKILPPLEKHINIFEKIDSDDIMIHHPYESFDPVVKFIADAAIDKDVVSIKMTLYRVGTNSPIVKALVDAAMGGKQVTVMVELKARFDEENNLIWAKRLESAGAHVVYGVKGLKVHAKLALVVKRVNNILKHYVHISTGNYNQATARVYTDISLFTAKKEFGHDATKFFHQITGFAKKSKLDTLYLAPLQIKPKILSMIENEAKKGKAGRIIAKINSLVDQAIIKALYKASSAGVKIDLIVRGVCTLRPNIKDISENINVISIIGHYLEHPRIIYFKHSPIPIHISSADWMPRNLERRVELMTPILDNKISNELYELLILQLSDNILSHTLLSDGTYKATQNGNKSVNSQKILQEYAQKIHNAKKKDKKTSAQKLAKRLLKDS